MPLPIRDSVIILLLLLFGAQAWAQPKDNSPYSRLGLGDLVPQTIATQIGTGGWGAGYNDMFRLNLLNPASFAFLQSTSFDVGMFAKFARLKGGNEAADIWSGNLGYMALGFPLKNPINESLEQKVAPFKWGMGFALTPYSNVGYNVRTTEVLPGIDTTVNNFQGTGGTYRATWSNGWKYKDFAVGVNLAYLFGQIQFEREVIFQDLGVAYQSLFDDDISFGGWQWDAGMQYAIVFKKKNDEGKRVPAGKRLVLGATARPAQGFRTNSSRLYQGFNFIYPEGDTVVNEKDVEGRGRLPMEWSAGLMFASKNKWRIGAEYRFARWSEYENDAKPEVLRDSWRISGGVEYTPDATSYNNYAKRIRYQAGLFYQTDPRSFKTELKNYGLTLGTNLPIVLPRQQVSFVQLALELGYMGAPEQLRETYGRLSASFTLNDNSWFFKRKFF
jgi:opacity protein-like surface antigen